MGLTKRIWEDGLPTTSCRADGTASRTSTMSTRLGLRRSGRLLSPRRPPLADDAPKVASSAAYFWGGYAIVIAVLAAFILL